mmetsp:Transcript_20628/g.57545  ORF Transcript_20628/g.57545 Transcript_20628/m.57545 type:complete len:585 (-) Transcript_20628:228-1982(-)
MRVDTSHPGRVDDLVARFDRLATARGMAQARGREAQEARRLGRAFSSPATAATRQRTPNRTPATAGTRLPQQPQLHQPPQQQQQQQHQIEVAPRKLSSMEAVGQLVAAAHSFLGTKTVAGALLPEVLPTDGSFALDMDDECGSARHRTAELQHEYDAIAVFAAARKLCDMGGTSAHSLSPQRRMSLNASATDDVALGTEQQSAAADMGCTGTTAEHSASQDSAELSNDKGAVEPAPAARALAVEAAGRVCVPSEECGHEARLATGRPPPQQQPQPPPPRRRSLSLGERISRLVSTTSAAGAELCRDEARMKMLSHSSDSDPARGLPEDMHSEDEQLRCECCRGAECAVQAELGRLRGELAMAFSECDCLRSELLVATSENSALRQQRLAAAAELPPAAEARAQPRELGVAEAHLDRVSTQRDTAMEQALQLQRRLEQMEAELVRTASERDSALAEADFLVVQLDQSRRLLTAVSLEKASSDDPGSPDDAGGRLASRGEAHAPGHEPSTSASASCGEAGRQQGRPEEASLPADARHERFLPMARVAVEAAERPELARLMRFGDGDAEFEQQAVPGEGRLGEQVQS